MVNLRMILEVFCFTGILVLSRWRLLDPMVAIEIGCGHHSGVSSDIGIAKKKRDFESRNGSTIDVKIETESAQNGSPDITKNEIKPTNEKPSAVPAAPSKSPSPSKNQKSKQIVADSSLKPPFQPLKNKQVCLFLKGESFRAGKKGSRVAIDLFTTIPRIGLPPSVQRIRDEQFLASVSHIKEIVNPLNELGAEKVVIVMDTTDTRPMEEREKDPDYSSNNQVSPSHDGGNRIIAEKGNRSRREELLRSFYEPVGGIERFVIRQPDPPALPIAKPGTKPPYWNDPLRTWLKEFNDVECSGGLVWTRPDLVFKENMGNAIRTAGWMESISSSAGEQSGVHDNNKPKQESIPDSFPSVERYSFIRKDIIPLDLGKLLYLSPTWAASEVIGKGSRGEGRWRVVDTFGFIPGWMLKQMREEFREESQGEGGEAQKGTSEGGTRSEGGTTSEGKSLSNSLPNSLPKEGLFRDHEALGFFDVGQKDFVERNVGWVALNSQHDSDSSADWNPFYRMAGRSSLNFPGIGDKPGQEVERKIADIGRGFG